MLLRAGADPRARNQLGMDALDFAVSGERPDAIELLTEARRRAPVRGGGARTTARASPSTSGFRAGLQPGAGATAGAGAGGAGHTRAAARPGDPGDAGGATQADPAAGAARHW